MLFGDLAADHPEFRPFRRFSLYDIAEADPAEPLPPPRPRRSPRRRPKPVEGNVPRIAHVDLDSPELPVVYRPAPGGIR